MRDLSVFVPLPAPFPLLFGVLFGNVGISGGLETPV